MKIDVWEEDVTDDGTLDYPAENGPGITTMYMKTLTIAHHPEHKFVSFTGYMHGMNIETRLPYDLIIKITERLKELS